MLQNKQTYFYAIGLSYEKADAEIRGHFSLSDSHKNKLLEQAKSEGVESLIVISTCNRTELYGFAEHPYQLIHLLCDNTIGTVEEFQPVSYIYKSKDAIAHLFKVGSGLDSQILGDFEIIGQLKASARRSKSYGLLNAFSERLLNSVIQASKRIKNETQLSSGATSVSFASVQYILNEVKNISEKNILLFGTGKIGRNTCENLVKHTKNSHISLINRTKEKAEEIAGKFNVLVKDHNDLEEEINQTNILIVATGAQSPTVKASMLKTKKPLLILDLSIPKNVNEDVKELPNVRLVHLDDLAKITDETLENRKSYIPKAQAIISEVMGEFNSWLDTLKFVPTIQALKHKLHDLKTSELNNQRKKIPSFDEEQAELISNSIIQKITNHFAHHLREDQKNSDESLELIKKSSKSKIQNTMSKLIRIGTRDSELAMWQAKIVQSQLKSLGYKSVLVPIKSTGDIQLDKPLYELGITGIFTKTLDIAMLNGDIDLAVHSLKDVPTILPKGIIQAAILKRGNVNDTLVFKDNEEFLSQKQATIATGSLRRRAQWLNRYPTHSVVDLRGNVNLRLQKLKDHNWNGAIFAAAGIGRLNLRPENAINLDWMIPAPGQGAIMIAVLESNHQLRDICSEINHEETEICTTIEREFLNRLEGGCTAPIGAIAQIKNEEVHFKAILLSKDGNKKVTVSKVMALGKHHTMAKFCADYVISKGGKTLMDEIKAHQAQANIYCTKTLSESQVKDLHKAVFVKSNDAVKINFNRLPKYIGKSEIEHVVITSKNAVESLLSNFSASELKFKNIYCVGRRTKKLIEQRIQKVVHQENNAEKLANYIIEKSNIKEVTFFCSDIRLNALPHSLEKNDIKVNEVVAYETKFDSVKINSKLEGVMFFSPSTVESYLKVNKPQGIAFCIGETTAKKARAHFQEVKTAKIPTIDSVIDIVNSYFDNRN